MFIKILKRTLSAIFDIMIVVASLFLATLITKESFIDLLYDYWYLMLVAGVICVAVNSVSGLYSKVLKFISFGDGILIVLSALALGVYFLVLGFSLETFSNTIK